jgi:Uma2 family endonuclease
MRPLLTLEAFRAFEAERPTERWELINFVPMMMACGTARHSRISGNVFASLKRQLASTPCEPFNSDMGVERAANGLAAYPDVSVRCGKPLDLERAMTDPVVLVEVVSPSSEACGTGFKLNACRVFESLQTYLVVFQDERRLQAWVRDAEAEIGWRKVAATQGALAPQGIDASLDLDEVYAGVALGSSSA